METLENDIFATAQQYLPTPCELRVLTDFFGIFADCTRLRVISALSISKMCVSELVRLLNINQTTCSHQLKLLRCAGVVETERKGKSIYYYLQNPALCDVLLVAVKYLRL